MNDAQSNVSLLAYYRSHMCIGGRVCCYTVGVFVAHFLRLYANPTLPSAAPQLHPKTKWRLQSAESEPSGLPI